MGDILIGKGDVPVHLLARYGNRHGLVAGATGTGKSVSLMVMAEGFSRLGVPVFMADVKGDIAGLAMPGAMNDRIAARVAQVGVEGYANEANPVVFWGPARPARPSGAHDRVRSRADAHGAHARAQGTQAGVLEFASSRRKTGLCGRLKNGPLF